MRLENIIVKEIKDSRGDSTIEVEIYDDKLNSFSAQIPSGKSRGKGEATVLKFADAQKVLNSFVNKELIHKPFNSVKAIDDFLIDLDGTKNKSRVGGNLMLGISTAYARALAYQRGKYLWQILNEEFFYNFVSKKKPLIFSNLINGGAHTKNNLDIQEYMVVVNPKKDLYQWTIKALMDFYKRLGDVLRTKYKMDNLPIGDEGGYAINFDNNYQPLEIMHDLVEQPDFVDHFCLALDVAASNFYKDGKYNFGGNQISSEKLNQIFLDYLVHSHRLVSIEDPFSETDFEGFKTFNSKCPDKWVVGDDLTVTNPELIEKYAREGLISGVIIKPNQIGSLSEACLAIRSAQENGLKTIVSHRSGETEDVAIIHLAKAGNVDAVKIGAPVASRMSKFEELIRLYD